MYIGIYVKSHFFLSDFNETWIFSTIFRRILISNFVKIRLVGTELFHAVKQTYRQAWRSSVNFRKFYEKRLKQEHWMKILAIRQSKSTCGIISSVTFRQDFRLQATAKQIRIYCSTILIKSLPYNESGVRQPFVRSVQFFHFLSLSPICV